MKFSMNKKALVAELTVWVAMAAKKSPKPILMHGYLEAIEQEGIAKLKLMSTDEAMQYVGECVEGISIQESGCCVVPAKDLFEIVKSFPDNSVIVLENDTQTRILKISSGTIQFTLCGLPSDEFPKEFSQIAPRKQEVWAVCEGPLFLDLLEKTCFAIATEEFRYNLCGLFCEYRVQPDIIDQKADVAALRMVATDGHRLALAEQGAEYEREISVRRLIPLPMINELRRVLTGWKGNISFCLEGRVLIFCVGGKMLITYPMEGEFPEYAQVIPNTCAVSMCVNREELLGAFRRISILSPKVDGGCIAWKFKQQHIEIASADVNRGDAKQEIGISNRVGGEEMEIGVASRYVCDLLSAMSSECVKLQIINAQAPIVIQPIENNRDMSNDEKEGSTGEIKANVNQSHIGIIMPRRL